MPWLDPPHELIEKGNRKRDISVLRAVDHPIRDESIAREIKLGRGLDQDIADINGFVRTRPLSDVSADGTV
ncbi:MAG: hypothetical protein OXD33_08180 [Rhodobacteraceae bacterium]|nr:hypothetical protein [Paracoccaceae bacterium]